MHSCCPDGAPAGPVNVVARFGPQLGPGGNLDLVIGAHYDSIAILTAGWRADRDPAPGANDNATGVAGLLEIARVLTEEHRAGRLQKSIAVVFFDEEELGMNGSRQWIAAERHGEAMINLDMVGFSGPGRKKLDLVRYPNSGDLADRVKAANERHALGLQLVQRDFPIDFRRTWVDSTPFAAAGVVAVTLTESYGQPGVDYPGYPGFHRVTDVPTAINNVPQWRAATQLVLAVALELAR
jgi:Zn-dependent M28 family amino/carboxypeptidase